jgi:nucleoid-associated protein YgaU
MGMEPEKGPNKGRIDMQTMPNKTRTTLAIIAVALAVVVGAFALWSGNGNEAAKAPETAADTLPATDDPTATLNGTTDAATTETTTDTADATTAEDEEAQPVSGTTIAPVAAEVPETHTVNKGETLRDIAQMYYNNPDYSGYIEAFNELENPNDIKAGDTIKLPKKDGLGKSSEQN